MRTARSTSVLCITLLSLAGVLTSAPALASVSSTSTQETTTPTPGPVVNYPQVTLSEATCSAGETLTHPTPAGMSVDLEGATTGPGHYELTYTLDNDESTFPDGSRTHVLTGELDGALAPAEYDYAMTSQGLGTVSVTQDGCSSGETYNVSSFSLDRSAENESVFFGSEFTLPQTGYDHDVITLPGANTVLAAGDSYSAQIDVPACGDYQVDLYTGERRERITQTEQIGQDWRKGKIVLQDECEAPAVLPTPVLTTVAATCDTPETLTLPTLENVTFSTPTLSAGPGTYSVVATASTGFTFENGETTRTLTGTLAGVLTTDACDEDNQVLELADFEVATTPATCDTGETLTTPVAAGATFVITGERVGPGSYTVTFTADEGFEFENGETTLVVTGELDGPLDQANCGATGVLPVSFTNLEFATAPANCSIGENLILPTLPNATWDSPLSLVGPRDYRVTLTADAGYSFADGDTDPTNNPTSVTFTGTLAGPLDSDECDDTTPVVVTPVVTPNTPVTVTPVVTPNRTSVLGNSVTPARTRVLGNSVTPARTRVAGTQQLARTGNEVLPVALGSITLLLAGGIALSIARRRQTQS